ncbi:MAG: PHP domain-containing protein, partial [Oleispira sp.]|nr:PHP domain-containing protein [Oleispira sp.]
MSTPIDAPEVIETLPAPAKFVHLRVHSEFSMIDGIVRIKEMIKTAVGHHMPAIALTDQSNMYALVKFYKAALGAGIKPIIGVDIWLENEEERELPHRLTLLAQNQEGYRHVTEIISQAYSHNQFDDKAIVRKEWLLEKAAGIIVLSGFRDGDIGQQIIKGNVDTAEGLLAEYLQYFGDRFYLELQRTNRENEELVLNVSLMLAQKLNVPVVATNDIRFINADDFEAHETRVCIGESYALADKRRLKRYSDQQYFRSPEDMVALFSDIPSAIENTLEIAKRCSVEVELGTYYLPDFPIP